VIYETLLENMVVLIGVKFHKVIRGKFQEPFFSKEGIVTSLKTAAMAVLFSASVISLNHGVPLILF